MSKAGPMKVFGFKIINKRSAKVFLRQLIGKFHAFAKIIKEEDRAVE